MACSAKRLAFAEHVDCRRRPARGRHGGRWACLVARRGRLARCFLLGAVLGTLLDGIHAYGDVLVYPDPAFGRWAWFVPVAVRPDRRRRRPADAAARTRRWRQAQRRTGRWPSAAGRGRCCSPRLYLSHRAGRAGRRGGAGGRARRAGRGQAAHLTRAAGDWVYVLAAAVLGPAGEAIISALGAFDYIEPDFAGIPLWLPALWANAGFLIRRLIGPIALSPIASDRTAEDRS